MSGIRCKLYPVSAQTHLSQVFTGFWLLQRSGRLQVTQASKRPEPPANLPHHLRDAHNYRLRLVVNDEIRIVFDVHDSWEIDYASLENTDFYFKRSLDPEQSGALGVLADKVYPLGLNYALFPHAFDWSALQRAIWARNGREVLRALDIHHRLRFSPRSAEMSAPPDPGAEPLVLFMASAYDPFADPKMPLEKAAEWVGLNEMRAACIDALRAALGDRFYGGFVHDDFSVENYRDQLMPEGIEGEKANYIDRLKRFPICVATTGLHGSTGWKFAEYVAFSKAIVSEPLRYRVPGDLKEGRNYLAFSTPEECVERSLRLIEDRPLRRQMMESNVRYYEKYLRPDVMVLNAIQLALKLAKVVKPRRGSGAPIRRTSATGTHGE